MTVFRHSCEFCGIHFTSDTPAKKYCSGQCKLKARHGRAIKRYEAPIVYLGVCDSRPGFVKIGTTGDPGVRLQNLRIADRSFVFAVTFPGSFELESRLHSTFADYRRDGEWFAITLDEFERGVSGAVRDRLTIIATAASAVRNDGILWESETETVTVHRDFGVLVEAVHAVSLYADVCRIMAVAE